jgi:hypothetical protein
MSPNLTRTTIHLSGCVDQCPDSRSRIYAQGGERGRQTYNPYFGGYLDASSGVTGTQIQILHGNIRGYIEGFSGEGMDLDS